MEKRKTTFNGKNVYLLGRDADGINHWLVEASWDCDWYWGFGYVQTFTNNDSPPRSRDIESHTHFDSLFFNGAEDGHSAFLRFFEETPLQEDEVWQLIELMQSFYTAQSYAELIHLGGSHYTKSRCAEIIKNTDERERINNVILPAIFNEIYKILDPDENE